MGNMRKMALEAKKRKGNESSNRTSAAQSPMASPMGSRGGSRYASEAEDFNDTEFDDTTTLSTHSASDRFLGDDDNATWRDDLQSKIADMEDRKRSSTQSRQFTLKSFLNIIQHHFAEDITKRAYDDVMSALVKSMKEGKSTEEQQLALKSLAVTILVGLLRTSNDLDTTIPQGYANDSMRRRTSATRSTAPSTIPSELSAKTQRITPSKLRLSWLAASQ
jgi:hypothetical protein